MAGVEWEKYGVKCDCDVVVRCGDVRRIDGEKTSRERRREQTKKKNERMMEDTDRRHKMLH
jgi:hypothetical protein